MASLLTYLLQLELLPDSRPSTKAAIFRKLVPGPGGWILRRDTHGLSESLGMLESFACVEKISVATRFWVAHREARATGGLRIRHRVEVLDSAFRAAACTRSGRWPKWFMNSYAHRLWSVVCRGQRVGFDIQDVEMDLGRDQPRPLTRAVA